MMMLLSCAGRLPRGVWDRACRLAGAMAFRLDRRHRQVALHNLERAFGDHLSDKDRARIATTVLANLCRMVFEIGRAMRPTTAGAPPALHCEGWHHLQAALKRGRGVLALTAHTGNWEMLALLPQQAPLPVHIVFRPLDSPLLDSLLAGWRTRFGARLIPKAHAMRKILTALQRREAVAVLLDQNVGWRRGVFVDFFGQPACTNAGLALIALKTGAPVVPVFALRSDTGVTALFGPEIRLTVTGDKQRDVHHATQLFTAAIEAFVRRHPDQWLWVHQRWKTRPRPRAVGTDLNRPQPNAARR
jgi:KDO2-lipid IV(A) lauroyltransferase